jgi:putative membrane protein
MQDHKTERLPRRDTLALDRTRLANHRTVLAYMRTVILLVGSGITLIKVFPDDMFLLYLGLAFFPIAVILIIIGTFVYVKTEKKLSAMYRNQNRKPG